MRKGLVVAIVSGAAGAIFVLSACVEDMPALAITSAAGALGGACLADGTCDENLLCDTARGRCIAGAGGSSSGAATSGGPVNPETSDSDAAVLRADAAPAACLFQTTGFPCKDQQMGHACYGDTVSCTATGCNPTTELTWLCNSPRQCGDSGCCLPDANATLAAGEGCVRGTLFIEPGVSTGPSCSNRKACPGGSIQLCQGDKDCPSGQRCAPVKVTGGPVSLRETILAVCIP